MILSLDRGIYLASRSPRRRELLSQIGVRFHLLLFRSRPGEVVDVDETTLGENVKVTHKSLFDGSLQGIERTDRPAFSFQGHPEASPGPHDVRASFGRFIAMIHDRLNAQSAAREAGRKAAEG